MLFSNAPIRALIIEAYDIGTAGDRPDMSRFKLIGGPKDILAARVDVDARAPSANADVRQKRAMLRTLLAERFKLRIKKETRQIPIYVLTMSPKGLGPKMKRSEMNCANIRVVTDRNSTCWVDPREQNGKTSPFKSAGSIAYFVDQAQRNLDRPLVDGTGLTGNFEWSTVYRLDFADADAPLFMDAIRKDFGLRFERRTGLFEVFVIESLDLPTPN